MSHHMTDIMIVQQTQATPDTYLRVRAALIVKGTTLHRWCEQNGVHRQTAEKALKGERLSPRARALVRRLIRAAGL
jgi:hypothetical protein